MQAIGATTQFCLCFAELQKAIDDKSKELAAKEDELKNRSPQAQRREQNRLCND